VECICPGTVELDSCPHSSSGEKVCNLLIVVMARPVLNMSNLKIKLNCPASPCQRIPSAHVAFTAAYCTYEHWLQPPDRRSVNMHWNCNAASCLYSRLCTVHNWPTPNTEAHAARLDFNMLGVMYIGSTISRSQRCLVPLSIQGLPDMAVLDHFCFLTIYSDNSSGFRPRAGSRQVVRSCSIPAAFGCRTSGM